VGGYHKILCFTRGVGVFVVWQINPKSLWVVASYVPWGLGSQRCISDILLWWLGLVCQRQINSNFKRILFVLRRRNSRPYFIFFQARWQKVVFMVLRLILIAYWLRCFYKRQLTFLCVFCRLQNRTTKRLFR